MTHGIEWAIQHMLHEGIVESTGENIERTRIGTSHVAYRLRISPQYEPSPDTPPNRYNGYYLTRLIIEDKHVVSESAWAFVSPELIFATDWTAINDLQPPTSRRQRKPVPLERK